MNRTAKAQHDSTVLAYDYSNEPRKPKVPAFVLFDREEVGSQRMPPDKALRIAEWLALAFAIWFIVLACLAGAGQ